MAIAQLFASLKAGETILKGIKATYDTMGKQELRMQIIDAVDKLLDAKDEAQSLRARLQELEAENADLKKDLEGPPLVYDDEGMFYRQEGSETPFCGRCKDVDEKLIHLLPGRKITMDNSRRDPIWHCPACKQGVLRDE